MGQAAAAQLDEAVARADDEARRLADIEFHTPGPRKQQSQQQDQQASGHKGALPDGGGAAAEQLAQASEALPTPG